MEEVEVLVPKWWSYLLRGLAAIAFAILILVWPRSTIGVLVIAFGILALVAGVVAIAAAIAEAGRGDKFFLSAALGVVSIIIGIVAITRPKTAVLGILFAIAAWAILYGFLIVVGAFELPKGARRPKWLLVLTGVMSIVIGIVLFMLPGASLGAIIIIVGAWLIAQGIFLVIVSVWMRSFLKEVAGA